MKQTMLTAEQKMKRLAENPEHAAIRRTRNYMTYTKLFERNKKLKRPVWHKIDIAAMAMDFKSKGYVFRKRSIIFKLAEFYKNPIIFYATF